MFQYLHDHPSDFTHSQRISGTRKPARRFSGNCPAVFRRNARIFVTCPLLLWRSPLHENALPFSTKVGLPVLSKGRCDQYPSSSAPDDPQRGLLPIPARYGVQRIGHDDHVKAFVGIRQVEHILHGEMRSLWWIICPASLPAIISGEAFRHST